VTLKADEKADALYLRLGYSRIIESEEVSPGVVGAEQILERVSEGFSHFTSA
jgi:hypothetical protein